MLDQILVVEITAGHFCCYACNFFAQFIIPLGTVSRVFARHPLLHFHLLKNELLCFDKHPSPGFRNVFVAYISFMHFYNLYLIFPAISFDSLHDVY